MEQDKHIFYLRTVVKQLASIKTSAVIRLCATFGEHAIVAARQATSDV
jgi:hypothetical protein